MGNPKCYDDASLNYIEKHPYHNNVIRDNNFFRDYASNYKRMLEGRTDGTAVRAEVAENKAVNEE